MPLQDERQDAIKDMFRIGFRMRDAKSGGGVVSVTVWVSYEALHDREPRAIDGERAIFERQRREIGRVASAKYDSGDLHNDGSVLVTAADLNQ